MRLRFTLALALALTIAPLARAHGGGVPQLTNAEVGPYRVSAWTQPDPIRVGEFHLRVAVSEPPTPGAAEGETGDLVLDAAVRVQVAPMGQVGETLVAFATREGAANKLFYEADLELPAAGRWQVSVFVEGPAGSGSASFEIEVLPASVSSSLWVFGGVALVLLATGWMVQTFTQRPPAESIRSLNEYF